MTKTEWNRFDRCTAALAVALMALTAALMSESQAQVRQSLKVSVRALPSVSIAGMDGGVERALADDMLQLSKKFQDKTGGTGSASLSSGFSISAYENITVLLSFTKEGERWSNRNSDVLRIICGYLNDGTTCFKRATVVNKNPIQFRLRDNNLMKRSMQSDNPLFVAYVFFLIYGRKEETKHAITLPVPTVTVEFI